MFFFFFLQGIPRNLSESQLVQIGSKALSNVAGQFSKLGQSLNPTKIRSSSKRNRNSNNPHIVYNSTTNIIDINPEGSEEQSAQFSVGKNTTVAKKNSASSGSDSDENDCSIYEPDDTDLVQENPIYNENVYMPGVGIVMTSNDAAANANQMETIEFMNKMSEDVCTVSISSVTDHVNMPAGMLDNTSPIRAVSPAPEIRVHTSSDVTTKSSEPSFSHSTEEVRCDETRLVNFQLIFFILSWNILTFYLF